jgi:hypothetical protein
MHTTSPAATDQPDLALLDFLIAEHLDHSVPRLDLLWDYYRNDLTDTHNSPDAPRPYRLAQERGLPARLTQPQGHNAASPRRREIVIENDIAWRIHALTDFMFSKPLTLQSLAPDPSRASLLESFLRQVLEANGGLGFHQDLALLGAVHGHVDVLLRTDGVPSSFTRHGPTASPPEGAGRPAPHDTPASPRGSAPATADSTVCPSADDSNRRGAASSSPTKRDGGPANHILECAKHFVLEVIEAPRAIPVLNPCDYRKLDAFIIHYRRVENRLDRESILDRLSDRVLGRGVKRGRRKSVECAEVWTAGEVACHEGTAQSRRRVGHAVNRLGRIPIVHIQNLPQPFFFEGLSEVEPLIPLQDELNTRLSDRANRVTFQSFKMYLGKGLDGFLERPVGPGQMWATDNPDASIHEFGGDGACPSEDIHITEIREAMDKASTVTPLAAGVIRDRVGNLTSENALRVTMLGMLARTEKKRVTYGQGIERMCELILHAADVLGVLPNDPAERRIRLDWPSPLPENLTQRLGDAKLKVELGVSRKQVLAELGYDDCPA